MYTVREINDPIRLGDLSEAWQALLPQTAGASFFHTLDWLETYWAHFGNKQRLRVMVVEDDNRAAVNRTIGIVPLVVRARRGLATVRVLTYPLDDWGSFYGPIGPDPAAALHAAL